MLDHTVCNPCRVGSLNPRVTLATWRACCLCGVYLALFKHTRMQLGEQKVAQQLLIGQRHHLFDYAFISFEKAGHSDWRELW